MVPRFAMADVLLMVPTVAHLLVKVPLEGDFLSVHLNSLPQGWRP